MHLYSAITINFLIVVISWIIQTPNRLLHSVCWWLVEGVGQRIPVFALDAWCCTSLTGPLYWSPTACHQGRLKQDLQHYMFSTRKLKHKSFWVNFKLYDPNGRNQVSVSMTIDKQEIISLPRTRYGSFF